MSAENFFENFVNFANTLIATEATSIFDPNNQKRQKIEKVERDYQPELDIDDDASWDQLRAKNLIKFASKNLNNTKNHDGPQKQGSIVVTEKTQVQALINALMKMHE